MNLLIVDDEIQILESIKLLFDWEELGFHIIGAAKNGLEALDYLNAYHVDILITDISMPMMNGLELIEKSKSLCPNLSVVIISSYDDFAYVKKALSLKVEDYLLKPIQEHEFLQVLDNLKEKQEKSLLYSTTYPTNHDTIRSNIFNRLIRNRISYIELEEKCQLFNLDLYHPFYNLAVIKLKGDNHSSNLFSVLAKHLELSTNYHEFFQHFDNNLVFICGNTSEESTNVYIQDRILAITTLLKSLQIDYIASIGYPVNDICECYKSYLNALHLSNQIITDKYSIQLADSSSQPSNTLNQLIELKTLRGLLINVNFPEITLLIESAFQNAVLHNGISFEIKNLALRFICWIDNFYEEQNISLDENSYYYDYLTISILESIKVSDLSRYILDHIQFYLEKQQHHIQQYSPIIIQIKKYIDEHFYDNISLKTLSYKFQINPSYLGQLFNKEVGEHFNDYLNKLKNEKALELLLNTNLSNQEIAQQLGYVETSYFYKKFKAYHGHSPNTMRKQQKKELFS